MIDCARDMLVSRDYSQVSLNEILRQSGGSKATLVKYFGNKAGLFRAVFEHLNHDMLAQWESGVREDTPEAALERIGVQLLSLYLRPEALTAYRAAIASGPLDSDLANGLYRGGHIRIVDTIAAHLENWRAAGLVATDDAREAAGVFTHMLRSGLYEETLIGLRRQPPTDDDIGEAARRAARIFLDGLRAGPARP